MPAAKEPRKGFVGVLDRFLALVEGVKGIALILIGLSVGGSTGTLMASDGDTGRRVDTLEARFDSVRTSVDSRLTRMERQQMVMFSAQVESDTGLRATLERSAENHRKAAESRAATQRLINDNLGIPQ